MFTLRPLELFSDLTITELEVCQVGAVFISIPEPIIGGVFCIVFAVVCGVGFSNLHAVDLNSSRNIFILGFSIFFSLTLSQWMGRNPGAISVGNESIDQILNILASTGMFVAGLTGFILDNTIPGTNAERGIQNLEELLDDDNHKDEVAASYDLPFGMGVIRRIKMLEYLPISPTYSSEEVKKPSANKDQNHPSGEDQVV